MNALQFSKKSLMLAAFAATVSTMSYAKTLIKYYEPSEVKVVSAPLERHPNRVVFKVKGLIADENINIDTTISELKVQSSSRYSWSVWVIGQRDGALYPTYCSSGENLEEDCPRLGSIDPDGNMIPDPGFKLNCQLMSIKKELPEILTEIFFKVSIPSADYHSLYYDYEDYQHSSER